jgi:hypothetical protein
MTIAAEWPRLVRADDVVVPKLLLCFRSRRDVTSSLYFQVRSTALASARAAAMSIVQSR